MVEEMLEKTAEFSAFPKTFRDCVALSVIHGYMGKKPILFGMASPSRKYETTCKVAKNAHFWYPVYEVFDSPEAMNAVVKSMRTSRFGGNHIWSKLVPHKQLATFDFSEAVEASRRVVFVPQDHAQFRSTKWLGLESENPAILFDPERLTALLSSLSKETRAVSWLKDNCDISVRSDGSIQFMNMTIPVVIPPDRLSGGQKDALLTLIGACSKEHDIAFLDEPGQNLGSFARRQLSELIHHREHHCKQFIVVTHHTEMLNRATLPDGVLFIRRSSYQKKVLAVVAKSVDVDAESVKERAEYRKFLRDVENLDLFFARGVICVEGKTDKRTLMALSELLYSNPEVAVRLLGGDRWTGFSWHIMTMDTCERFQKARALCDMLDLPFVCIGDMDYLFGSNASGGSGLFCVNKSAVKNVLSDRLPCIACDHDGSSLRFLSPEAYKILSAIKLTVPIPTLEEWGSEMNADEKASFLAKLDEKLFKNEPEGKFLEVIAEARMWLLTNGDTEALKVYFKEFHLRDHRPEMKSEQQLRDYCTKLRKAKLPIRTFIWGPDVADIEGLYMNKRMSPNEGAQTDGMDEDDHVFKSALVAIKTLAVASGRVTKKNDPLGVPVLTASRKAILEACKKRIDGFSTDDEIERLTFCISAYSHVADELKDLFSWLQHFGAVGH